MEDIEEVRIETGPVAFTSAGIRDPKSGVEGKFSLWFLASLALGEGEVTLDKFTDAKINDPQLLLLRKKINASLNRKLGFGAEVSVIMKDGTEYKKYRKTPKGDPRNPLTHDELIKKFRNAAGLNIPGDNVEGLIQELESLENLDTFKRIFWLARSPSHLI